MPQDQQLMLLLQLLLLLLLQLTLGSGHLVVRPSLLARASASLRNNWPRIFLTLPVQVSVLPEPLQIL